MASSLAKKAKGLPIIGLGRICSNGRSRKKE